jgi:hypothetical protein
VLGTVTITLFGTLFGTLDHAITTTLGELGSTTAIVGGNEVTRLAGTSTGETMSVGTVTVGGMATNDETATV